jgi:hypothetical protein
MTHPEPHFWWQSLGLEALWDPIQNSALSQWLRTEQWVIPASQSIHILAASVVFGCAILVSLRLLGVSVSGRPASALVRTLIPWMYRGLGLALFTGVVQTLAEPMRQFVTPLYWYKMFMIVIAVFLTWWLAASVSRRAEYWDAAPKSRPAAPAFAVIWLALWVAIVLCGRFIAYTWALYTA